MDQFWSWVLTAIGLTGFWLAGRKVWWCWYVNIANQILWLSYSLITEQWGFLVGVGFYLFVFIKNARLWTKEHFAEPDPYATPEMTVETAQDLGFPSREKQGP